MGFYYSLDLRQKVLKALNNHSQTEVSKMFNIARTTVYRWRYREKEGNLAPIINHNKTPHRIDRNKLMEYIHKDNPEKNYNKTLKEIAIDFNVTDVAILKTFRKLGYVIKKN